MVKKGLFLILCLMILGLSGVGVLFYWWQKPLSHPPITLFVKPRMAEKEIFVHLTSKGLPLYPWLMRLCIKIFDPHYRPYQVGEYAFTAPTTPKTFHNTFSTGRVVVHALTLREGLTSQEILDTLHQSPHLVGPSVDSLPQGSILPETYFITWPTTRLDLIKRSQKAQTTYIEALEKKTSSRFSQNHAPGSLSREEKIILASLIEMETPFKEEKPLVAQVFYNRLKKGMPLQSDPTVKYALFLHNGTPLDKVLSRQDLKVLHAYNTYLHKGLPPGPICHPGAASLRAAYFPKATEALFFIVDDDGQHHFSATYQEHARYHKKLRERRKRQGQKKTFQDKNSD